MRLWTCCSREPSSGFVGLARDYPLLKVRLLHWLNFRYSFTGFLHWGWNYWTPEPVKDTQPVIDANTQLLPPGDAFINARSGGVSQNRTETTAGPLELSTIPVS